MSSFSKPPSFSNNSHHSQRSITQLTLVLKLRLPMLLQSLVAFFASKLTFEIFSNCFLCKMLTYFNLLSRILFSTWVSCAAPAVHPPYLHRLFLALTPCWIFGNNRRDAVPVRCSSCGGYCAAFCPLALMHPDELQR